MHFNMLKSKELSEEGCLSTSFLGRSIHTWSSKREEGTGQVCLLCNSVFQYLGKHFVFVYLLLSISKSDCTEHLKKRADYTGLKTECRKNLPSKFMVVLDEFEVPVPKMASVLP